MAASLRKEAFYPYPPSTVWTALTDPHALAEWLMPNNFKPIVGHKFRFEVDPMPGCDPIVRCEVIEVERPKRLVYTWVPDRTGKVNKRPGTSTLTWTLVPEGGGTRLILEHVGLEIYPWWQRMMLRFGWGTMVKRWIPKICGNVTADGGFSAGVFPLAKRCYKCQKVSPEMVR
jgi:uncharacterized protein YndB with AHSA1/START domain